MSNKLLSMVYFFEREMPKHNLVASCRRLPLGDDIYIYEVQRSNGPSVKVHLSDAYQYDLGDYLSRPKELGRGDYIFANEYVRDINPDVVERARLDRIGVGGFGKLKGALNRLNIWEYESPAEKAGKLQRQKGKLLG